MEVAAYSTVAMTLSLVVARPRLGPELRISPAMAAFGGVAVMMLLGIVRPGHFERAAINLWSPFVAIAAIMVMTDVAHRVGLLDWWAARVEARARTTRHLFGLVFALGVLTSATLNNDAAILLLTPLVVSLVRRRYPDRPQLLVVFAFAVFISAGVAALPVSNPMNMVVAEFTGIDFNTYALHMVPVAIAGWLIGFVILRRIFAAELAAADAAEPARARATTPPRATAAQRWMMALLAGVLLSYPIVGYFGGPVWAVASAGAVMALVLATRHGNDHPLRVAYEGVSWETLAFLMAVLILSMGLFEVGLVDRLTALYYGGDVGTVGATSAVGSALLNNHPMSHLNMMALESAGASDVNVLAALVGGDLGPRLLPMGSLAGLLWLELLRRRGVEIRLRTFVKIGAAVTLPALVVCLAILALY
jgi:arsenical pump membrane protein